MHSLIVSNLVIPVQSMRKPFITQPIQKSPLFTKQNTTDAGSLDDSTAASTSPRDPLNFGDRKSSFCVIN